MHEFPIQQNIFTIVEFKKLPKLIIIIKDQKTYLDNMRVINTLFVYAESFQTTLDY